MLPPPPPPPCNMAQMTYPDELCYAVVAKICQDVGWHTAHKGTLTMLAQLMRNYMRGLSSIAVDYANHGGRNQPNVDDLAMTFKYMNIDLIQMQDYVLNVDSSSFPQKVPVFPLPCRTNRAIENCAPSNEERPEYYEEWMPSLIHNKSLVELDQSFEQNQASKDEVDADKGQQNLHSKTNGTDKPSDEVDSGALATSVSESENQKNKLVIRFSLSKSIDDSTEENRVNADDEDANETNLSASALIAKSYKKSRAYLHFINSSLYKNPDNPETKSTLRVADTQRLPNTHQSRENSPEPEPQSIYHNGASNEALNHSTLSDSKKARRLKKKKNRVSDFDDPAFDFFDDGLNLTPKLKVKDFGPKKERKSKNGDSTEKKSKKKFLPFSIKMPGIGMADDNAANMFDFAEPSQFDSGGEFMPKTKRQYKKKEKPPKVPSERGRGRPKKIKEPLLTKPSQFDLEDGELPPSPSSLSPTKSSKKKEKSAIEGFSFGENEAAKTLVLMSESNETSLTGDQDRKHKFDDMESTGDDSMADPNSTNSKTTPKKLGRPLKRPKGSATKKFVKSAEIIESSGDSSDDDANVDSNPVSLLPPLPEPALMSMSDIANATENSNLSSARKRRNSNSSISSISSLESSISSSSLTLKLKVHSKSSSKKHKSRESKTDKDFLHRKEPKMDGKKESKKKKIKTSPDVPLSLVFKPPADGDKQHKKEKLHKKEKREKRDESMLKFDGSSSSSKQKFRDPKTDKGFLDKREFLGEAKKESKPKKVKDAPLILVLKTSNEGEKQHKKEKNDESLLKFEVTKPSSKKFREQHTEKDLLYKKDPKMEGKKSKKVKVKDAPISLIIKTPSDGEKHHKKEKSKEESKSSKKQQVHADVSCSVITETIKVDETVEEEVYFCPACSLPDTGTPMIGCDNCDQWFHYVCVGIITTPADDAKWFCIKCAPRVKGDKSEHVPKKVKKRDSALIDNSVTITPIPPLKSNLSAQFGSSSGMSLSSGSVGQHQPAMTITPTGISTVYKPTGRPRGRPRKDSYQSKPQVTITPVSPPQFQQLPFQPPFAPTTHHIQPAEKSTINRFSYPSADHLMNLGPSTSYDHSTVPSKPSSTQKRSKKEICPTCNDTTKDRRDLIRCEICSQWYHWGCVGIKSPPSPDSNWYCRPCKGQKSSKHSTLPVYMEQSSVPLAPTGTVRRQPETPSDSDSDNDVSAKQRCGTCFQASAINEDVSNWVACDECDQWFHFACQNVTHSPPPEESWFCKKCIARQKSIANRLAKVRRFNPQS